MSRKVLMVGWGYPPKIDGGLDVHVANLFESLNSNGVEADLILPEDRAPDKENVIPVEAGNGDMFSKSHRLSQKVMDISGDYDIVHTHDWFGSESGLKAKKYGGANWVSTFHSLASNRARNPSHRTSNLERAMVEQSDEVMAVSDSLAEEVEDLYGRKPRVVHNGFPETESSGQDMKDKLEIDREMILYVGRHAEQKGIEHLIYGFSKLNRDSHLVIGGEGHMTPSLEKFVDMLDIGEDVTFTGFIPDEELGDYYASADVFVSPSISEPFGLTVVEALKAGTPVVATESGAEELIAGNAIVKVEPDSDSIREGIEKALSGELKPEFESRSWEQVAEEVSEVYMDLT